MRRPYDRESAQMRTNSLAGDSVWSSAFARSSFAAARNRVVAAFLIQSSQLQDCYAEPVDCEGLAGLGAGEKLWPALRDGDGLGLVGVVQEE
jgi:hypothetical protein